MRETSYLTVTSISVDTHYDMVSSIAAPVTSARLRVTGFLAWVVAAVVIHAPLQERILLLAPLVVVPALLAALPPREIVRGVSTRNLTAWVMAAAVLLPLATAHPRGPLSGALAVPWLVLGVLVGIIGLRHAAAGLPQLLRPPGASALASDAALVGLAVGAGWLWIDRAGLVVPGISPLIGQLTAVHFHFAVFGLVGVGALVARARPGVDVWAAVLAIAIGSLVTAMGFLSLFAFQWIGALMVGSGGLLLAKRLVRGPNRPPVRAAGVALAVGMVLAIAWPTSRALAPGLLDIDLMVRTHGVLNGVAVTLLAWTGMSWMEVDR